jgi:hypothetical protein
MLMLISKLHFYESIGKINDIFKDILLHLYFTEILHEPWRIFSLAQYYGFVKKYLVILAMTDKIRAISTKIHH